MSAAILTRSDSTTLPEGLPGWMYKVRAVVEYIDVATAKRYMKRNTANYRPLAESRWEPLAEMMENDQWQQLNGDTIVFSTSAPGRPSRLLNGQNRLQAAIETNTPLITVVVYGIPEENDLNMDTGAKRKLRDVLAKDGHEHPNELATTLGLLHSYTLDPFGVFRYTKYPNGLLKDLLRDTPDIERAVSYAVEQKKNIGIGPGHIALARHLIFHAEDGVTMTAPSRLEQDIDIFFSRLALGEHIASIDPVWHLRRAISQSANAPKMSEKKKSSAHLFVLLLKTWNMFRSGSVFPEGTHLFYRSNERFPIPF